MKVLRGIIIGWLLFCCIWPQMPASAATSEFKTIRFKGLVFFVSSMDLYALNGDDGKKYHPIRKLPNDFLVDGLEVVVEGKLRDDLVGERMWGPALEVVKIYKASQYIGPEDREAIRLLLARMDAFNTLDLAKLQNIDVVAGKLTQDQFISWIADNSKFTLHYAEASPVGEDSTIKGICLYSRQPTNSISLVNNMKYTVMKFTLSKVDNVWKFTETENYVPEYGKDMGQVVEELMDKAEQKFHTTDLATWKG